MYKLLNVLKKYVFFFFVKLKTPLAVIAVAFRSDVTHSIYPLASKEFGRTRIHIFQSLVLSGIK